MLLYRVCNSAFAGLDGEGARLYGGRWNSAGIAVVYTATSLALAVLETRVHLRKRPIGYVRLTIEIPDSVFEPVVILPGALDSEWRSKTAITRGIGDAHFSRTPLVPLKAPSVVVETEWNVLFSREYAAAQAAIVEEAPLMMDPRLWND